MSAVDSLAILVTFFISASPSAINSVVQDPPDLVNIFPQYLKCSENEAFVV